MGGFCCERGPGGARWGTGMSHAAGGGLRPRAVIIWGSLVLTRRGQLRGFHVFCAFLGLTNEIEMIIVMK